MEGARSTWNDERLDDLARRVDDGFRRVDDDIRALRTEMSGRFDAVDRRFDAIDARFDALQRTMIQFGGGMVVAVLATLITVILSQG